MGVQNTKPHPTQAPQKLISDGVKNILIVVGAVSPGLILFGSLLLCRFTLKPRRRRPIRRQKEMRRVRRPESEAQTVLCRINTNKKEDGKSTEPGCSKEEEKTEVIYAQLDLQDENMHHQPDIVTSAVGKMSAQKRSQVNIAEDDSIEYAEIVGFLEK